MPTLLRSWFTSTGTVSRGRYFVTGVGLALLKYSVDAVLIEFGAGRAWMPVDYLRSAPFALNWPLAHADTWLLPVLLIWTVPFLWIGVMMTSRRLRDAGWSAWLCFFFFAPYANYLLMAVLCAVPTASDRTPAPTSWSPGPDKAHGIDRGGWLVAKAMAAGIVPGIAMTMFGVLTLRSYGGALFFGVPFVMGTSAAFVFNRPAPATRGATNGVVAGMLVLAGGAFLLVGFEGAVCLMMALPLAIPLGLLGGMLGRNLAMEAGARARTSLLAIVAIPFWMVIEPPHSTGRILHEVHSSIDIAASPDVVWPRVIAFDPLPPPTELVFRLGVASPRSAHIDGAGIGAVRYCEFSTGAFVEPITRWEPDHRLSFDVSSSPAPMEEWSPYARLHPPHLDGFLRSRRGEFRLVALDGGHTRLEGSTWYELEMGPEGYWQMFSDHLIHRIHMRVLEQIKRQAEQGAR